MSESSEAAAPLDPATAPPLSVVDRVKLVRDVFYVVALFGAGVWAIGTFYYHSIYLPSHEQPVVTSSITLTPLGERDGKLLVNAHLVMKNETNVVQDTWAISFRAFGRKLSADAGWHAETDKPNQYAGALEFRESEPVLLGSSVNFIVEKGRSFPIRPHSEEHEDFYFYADRAGMDSVDVDVDVIWPDRALAPKPEWFTLRRGEKPDEMPIVPTEACRQTPDCNATHSHFSKKMSLWPAPDQRGATSAIPRSVAPPAYGGPATSSTIR